MYFITIFSYYKIYFEPEVDTKETTFGTLFLGGTVFEKGTCSEITKNSLYFYYTVGAYLEYLRIKI